LTAAVGSGSPQLCKILLNFEPGTSNVKPRTLISNTEPGTLNPEPGTWNFEPRNMLPPAEIKQYLSKAFWDVDIDPGKLYHLLTGQLNQADHITKERLFRRLMETYSWYQILEIVPADQLNSLLDEELIGTLRTKTLQKRYAALAEILRKNPIPLAG
jgi:hypothetical protein